ncbi:MAG: hypothetical protein MUF49_06130 [Oculatellaceae cyanobacterium Prado106]|jgi:hypothetical protein|nr:hypothetical protein [Oculatellaceae cyanobacterium Prado106]
MPISKQTPASLRYLKARFQVLKRPMLWGATATLVLAAALLTEYFTNLDYYTSQFEGTSEESRNRSTASALPQPIDPLLSETTPETFFSDLTPPPRSTSSSPSIARNLAASLGADPKDSALQQFLLGLPSNQAKEKAQGSSAATSTSATAVSSSLSSLSGNRPSLGMARTSNSPTASPTSPFATSSPDIYNRAARRLATDAPTNPLQAALDRYAAGDRSYLTDTRSLFPNAAQSGNQLGNPSSLTAPNAATNSAATNSTAVNSGVIPGTVPGASSTVGGANLQPSGFQTYATGEESAPLPTGLSQNQPRFAPQISPPPGTTGYTLPPAFRTPATPSTPSYGNTVPQPVPGVPAPAIAPDVPRQSFDINGQFSPSSGSYGSGSSAIGVPSSDAIRSNPAAGQIVQPAAPAPAPFSAPRSMGGGRINTFSNP